MNAGQPERATRLPESARWGVLYPRAPRSSADRQVIRDESRCDDAIRTQKTPRAVCFRDDPGVEVVAFTATQIPGISGRVYPPALAGSRYPGGIPILPETPRGGVERYASTRDVLAAAEEAGQVNVRAADILVVNKVNAASRENVEACIARARSLNPDARIVEMQSTDVVSDEAAVRGRRVLAVDDGPSLTHGGMAEGVAGRAARALGAQLVDPRPGARGSIADAFVRVPHLGMVLPALGYGEAQLACTDRAREAGRHSSLNGAGAPAGGQVDALKPPRARPPIRR